MTAAFRRRTGRKLGDLPRSVGEEESGVVCGGACVWEKEGLLDSLKKSESGASQVSKDFQKILLLAPGFFFFASRDFFIWKVGNP